MTYRMALYHVAATIGACLARLGQGDFDALSDFYVADQEVQDISSRLHLPYYRTEAGLGALRLGESRNYVSEMMRLSGRIAVTDGEMDLAEQEFTAARTLAQEHPR